MSSPTPNRDAVERLASEMRKVVASAYQPGTPERATFDLANALADPVLLCLADAMDTQADLDEVFDRIAAAWANTVVSVATSFPDETGDPVPCAVDLCARIGKAISNTIRRKPDILKTARVEQPGKA